ncbi:MAG TPA: hypothetical protein PKN32_03485 [Bacteroidales bacterium]|nr:hypothetical protein [Bacteroidales bacterium]
MKKLLIIFNLLFVSYCVSYAETIDTTKISGKPLFIIFTNFHQGLSENAHESNFDLKRAYIGYDFNLNNGFTAVIKLDIGSPDDNSQYSLIRRNAYFKNVGIGYSKNKLQVNFGIIDNQQHKIQEKFWNKRYIFKTVIDEYKFQSSADLGINACYKFNPKFIVEAGMMNGEYLNLQNGFGKYIYNLGFNITPAKQLTLKLHSSFTSKINDVVSGGVFIGYTAFNKLKIGLEYDCKYDIQEVNTFLLYAYSANAAYDITNKLSVFARYDALCSNIPDNYTIPWNLAKNGTAIIAGAEYRVNENFRLSLNYQDWYPMAANMNNISYIYLNLEFGIFESYKRI